MLIWVAPHAALCWLDMLSIHCFVSNLLLLQSFWTAAIWLIIWMPFSLSPSCYFSKFWNQPIWKLEFGRSLVHKFCNYFIEMFSIFFNGWLLILWQSINCYCWQDCLQDYRLQIRWWRYTASGDHNKKELLCVTFSMYLVLVTSAAYLLSLHIAFVILELSCFILNHFLIM